MTLSERRFSPLDRLLGEIDHGLRTCFAPAPARRPRPGTDRPPPRLTPAERGEVGGLMRVNHAGEIAAQALYRGQAAVARDENQRTELLRAADEEQDHLAWCAERLAELGDGPSRLAPFWYVGSLAIGMAAGAAGDRWSLGFVEETEIQVSAHLDEHLDRLPGTDTRSRAIVERMREDEARHAEAAREAGATPLPPAVKTLMTRVADLMRFVSYRF